MKVILTDTILRRHVEGVREASYAMRGIKAAIYTETTEGQGSGFTIGGLLCAMEIVADKIDSDLDRVEGLFTGKKCGLPEQAASNG